MTMTDEVWEAHGRYGNKIYMTAERWHHALDKRPWLVDFLADTLDTLRNGRRQQDPLNPQKYKYYRPCPDLEPEYNNIVAIVLFKK
ncbi:MAG: FAD-binding oxidoreductase [Chloroflexi bacterium]|nr:FAD-binding oxidoreductase [Chloroflexota bacterium]